ncbi:MAG TPA: nicotinate-nucleotide adenylyltransferase [Dehalococcoidales bacterium]|jgi:nicotinate-nucleotide adenylyltransferase|nr:nicotinate-nucleotide adenylyltransferase [Dehalococcoidales bacterium]
MKIGVLGGTFDPIHNGHLAIAEEARAYLNLNEVIFLPAGQPWMKSDRSISPARHRTAMIALALQSRPYFKTSTIEIEHQGPSYSVNSIAELKTQAVEPTDWYFILGWDNLSKIPQWREPAKLIEMCFLAAVPRPGYERPNMKKLEAALPGIAKKVILMDKPRLEISATDIRNKAAQGLPISGLVPEAVEKYIKENGLYRK